VNDFLGFHSEWNLGSPGGWDYQRITQELGRLFWQRVKQRARADLPAGLPEDMEPDFSHHMFMPVLGFAQTLLRASRNNFPDERPFLVLTAEPDTLETVLENKNFVDRLDAMEEVSATLAAPHELEVSGDRVTCRGHKVTAIFQDFNADVMLELEKEYDLAGLRAAIKAGLVLNPKGMEPVGVKSVFEAVTGEFRDRMSPSTVERTPWTRLVYDRATTGPHGEEIADFPEWCRTNIHHLVLKPVQGYSGKGVIVGYRSENPEADVQAALDAGNYIAQELIPLALWSEDSPWLADGAVALRRWQTDFRCLITETGVIGFLARFGGVPTNVGSGGGTQPLAVIKGSADTRPVVRAMNKTVLSLGAAALAEIKAEVDELSMAMGNTYLLGPIPLAMRPRVLNESQISALNQYGLALWKDCVTLAGLWREGKLGRVAQITDAEREVAELAPWNGQTAMMASDGLFSFGGHPLETDQPAEVGSSPHEGF
jgi:hypothetical protein